MSTNGLGSVVPAAAVVPATGATPSVSEPQVRPQPKFPVAAPVGDQRLVIQEIGHTGQYVYTIVDRATDRVIVQIPREEVLKQIGQDGYVAGALVSAKA